MGKFFVHAKRMTSDVRGSIDGYMKEAESEIIADERKKIKELIEAEIKSVDPMENDENEGYEHPEHHDEEHQDAEHHEQDEYFEKAEDDPAYADKEVKQEKDGVWSQHSEEDDSTKKS
jgi:hypothetical protein